MTKFTVLAQSTRVAREYGGHVNVTLAAGTTVRNVTERATGYAFEYASAGIHWKLAFTDACPVTKEAEPESEQSLVFLSVLLPGNASLRGR